MVHAVIDIQYIHNITVILVTLTTYIIYLYQYISITIIQYDINHIITS